MSEVSRLCDCVIKLWQDKENLWQWDIDQRVEVLEDDLSLQVHFVHNGEVLAVGVYEEGGKVYANIPNILLQMAGRIRGWVYRPGESASTLGAFDFTVVARQKSPDYVYTETEILTWYQLSERISQLEENGVGGSGAFIVDTTPDENWNPVPSHTREEVLAAINERKFVVLRIDGYELTLAPYPEFGEILPDDAELRFAVETGGRTLYLYWTAEGISFSEDDWVSRYTGLPEGNHSKNGTSHLIEAVSQDVYGICYFAFRAFGDYRTGDTFTIRFYDGGDSEPYDVKVTPKLWNTEDLPDKYFTNGAIVTCAFKDGTVPTLYFMGGMGGKDGKTPVKGEDYFTDEDVLQVAEEAAKLVTISEVTPDKVIFPNGATTTYPIGKVELVNGMGTLVQPGGTLADFFNNFVDERFPEATDPSVSITFSQAKAYEVGSKVTPSYSATFDPGSYTYGPATGITVTAWEVTDTANHKATKASGSFAQFQVTDNISYKITAKATHGAGAVPVTNTGNPYPAEQIASGSKSKTSGAVTGYRNTFYGTLTAKSTITSSVVRGLAGKSEKALANGNSFTVTIPVGALRVVIAYPATLRDVTSIKDVNGMNAEIASSFTKSTVNVEGANSYTAISYKVYTLDFANANDTANKFTVQI